MLYWAGTPYSITGVDQLDKIDIANRNLAANGAHYSPSCSAGRKIEKATLGVVTVC